MIDEVWFGKMITVLHGGICPNDYNVTKGGGGVSRDPQKLRVKWVLRWFSANDLGHILFSPRLGIRWKSRRKLSL